MTRGMRWAAVLAAVALAAGPVQAATFILYGDYLRVGVSNSGGLINDTFTVGIDYDKTGTATWSAWDFLKPGTPFEFYSIGYGGATWNDAGYWHGNAFSATSVDTSAGAMNSARTTGTYGPLAMTQDLWYVDGTGWIDFRVTLTNTSGNAVSNVVYARGLDPDQDVYAGGGYPTTNVIVSNDIVTASAPVTDWTIAIYSGSAYPHKPSIDYHWNTNPYYLYNTPPNDGNGDNTINMAWFIGTLNPGQSADITFQYRIAETQAGAVIPEPVTMAGLVLGVGGLAGYVRRRRA